MSSAVKGNYSQKMEALRAADPARWLEKVMANRRQCAAWARANSQKVTARVRAWQLRNATRFKALRHRSRAAQRDRIGGGQQILLTIEMQALPPLATRETASSRVSSISSSDSPPVR